MSRIQRFVWPFLVVLAFAAGATWHLAPAQEAKPRQKWEYTFGAGYSEQNISQMGDEGWELVAGVQSSLGTTLYFKRPK